ncbi:hypothetical protein [Kitasatospora sp. NPDC047058]|uniref:hypothetical protein n=1 Tax=Kitasatospora sp. NPDC047058 TaxID=3155620 RepID=UPI0033DC2CDF
MSPRRPAAALVAALLALPVAGCSAGAAGSGTTGTTGTTGGSAGSERTTAAATLLGRFEDSGVTVTVALRDWHDGAGTLELSFTPVETGFHLYATDLPPDGVDGVGRPTTARTDGALGTTAPLAVTAPVRRLALEGVTGTVPVYPDGPVTAGLPVRAAGTGPATLHLGYAACSETKGCLLPVADHPVPLTITPAGPTAGPTPAPTGSAPTATPR